MRVCRVVEKWLREIVSFRLTGLLSAGPIGQGGVNGKVLPVDHKPPTAVIESAHGEHELPWDDTTDFDNADRGFIAALTPCVIKAADGRVVWDNDVYSFLEGPAPTSVRPNSTRCGAIWSS